MLQAPAEQLSTSETATDETVREIRGPIPQRAKPSEEPALFTALKQRTPAVDQEVNQVLDQVELAEFGPAEWPLRELATISVLTRHGVTTEQVTVINILLNELSPFGDVLFLPRSAITIAGRLFSTSG